MSGWKTGMKRRLRKLQGREAGRAAKARAAVRSVIEPYFSAEYYLATYPDVQASGQDPLDHFVRWGAQEGRRPSRDFDPQDYRNRFPGGYENPLYDAVVNGRYTRRAAGVRVPETDPKKRMTLWPLPAALPGSGDRSCPGAEGTAELGHTDEAIPNRGFFALLNPSDVALIAAHLDENWYRCRYPEAAAFGGSLAAYYLALGWLQGHDPSPGFSTSYYLAENPDVASTGMNPLLHHLHYGKSEKWRRTASVADAAVLKAFGTRLASDVAEAVALDPMVALPVGRRVVTSPFDLGVPLRSALRRLRRDLAGRPFAHVVLIPQVRLSGAARVAGLYASELARQVGIENILIVRTDGSADEHPEWFPQGVRSYDLSTLLAPIADKTLHPRMLFDLLRGVEAQAIHLFNSRLGWDTLEMLGRQLSQEVTVTAYLFTWEETDDGRKVGYPIQWLRETIEYCHTIICDSAALAQHIRDRFALPAEGPSAPIVALTPARLVAPETFAAQLSQREGRKATKTVLWAGRLDRQKRPDILEAVARRMPDVRFEVYGRAVISKAPEKLGSLPNVTLMGEYDDFHAVIARDYDAFLYTAQWDGLPTILLDVVGKGLPIVASVVGGIGELIDEETGWPVRDIEDIAAYCAALKQASAMPAEAVTRARAAYNRARETYAPQAYAHAVAEGVRRGAVVIAARNEAARSDVAPTSAPAQPETR